MRNKKVINTNIKVQTSLLLFYYYNGCYFSYLRHFSRTFYSLANLHYIRLYFNRTELIVLLFVKF